MFFIENHTIPEGREDPTKWLFSCDGCYGKFPTRKALVEHLDRKLFKCLFRDCKQRFSHKYELDAHQRICPSRLKSSSFDCYKIYHMIDVRHKPKPRRLIELRDLDQWVKYPYWQPRQPCHYIYDYVIEV